MYVFDTDAITRTLATTGIACTATVQAQLLLPVVPLLVLLLSTASNTVNI
jgi:hypothetical protein